MVYMVYVVQKYFEDTDAWECYTICKTFEIAKSVIVEKLQIKLDEALIGCGTDEDVAYLKEGLLWWNEQNDHGYEFGDYGFMILPMDVIENIGG